MDAPLSPSLPEPRPRSTWWKRLFTVLEIGAALFGFILGLMLFISERRDLSNDPSFWEVIIFTLVPVIFVRLLRMAVTFVVEGRVR